MVSHPQQVERLTLKDFKAIKKFTMFIIFMMLSIYTQNHHTMITRYCLKVKADNGFPE